MNKLTIIISLLFFIELNASGFQINEHGTKAMSLGGAFAGLADDPSAIYFNPAGITQLNGINLIGGSTLIIPGSTFRGPSPSVSEYEIKSQIFTPVHIYATYQFEDKLFFGFGIGNNFGLGTEWDSDWAGKYLAVETSLRTFFFNFVTSYQIIPQISIGFGYSLVYGDVLMGRKLNLSPFNSDAYLELEGNGIGSGFTAGLLFHATNSISLGFSYRSKVSIQFKGDATLKERPEQLANSLPNGAIDAPLTTPENITFGIAVKPLEDFTLTADYQYIGWDSYDNLKVNFNEFIDEGTGDNLESVSIRNYENSFIARIGISYKINDKFNLYSGFLYDKNPVKDEYLEPTLPDADRFGISGGFSYSLYKNIGIEAGYLFLRFDERKISNSLQNYGGIEGSISPFNGVYNSVAHLISVTINYKI